MTLPPPGPAISLIGVTKRFGAKAVVDSVTLEVAAGEIVSLVGRSGSGKSTLLRLVAGLETPDAGEVRIAGASVAGAGLFVEPERRGVGFMFQDYALFPHLTVARNVSFGLKNLDAREAGRIAEEMLERVGLAGLGGRYPHMLSGGEQQRVALARALAPEPAALMMDEPFSNLDRRLGERLRGRTLALIRDLGAAAILVTHDPEEAMASGDRVALMQDGAIVEIGTGEDIYRRPKTREAADFFCAAAAARGFSAGGAVETRLGRFPAPASLRDGAPATVYVRARDLKLARDGEGVSALVLAKAFLGHAHELLLAVDGLDEPVRAHAASAEAITVGDRVHVFVNPADGLVFADDLE